MSQRFPLPLLLRSSLYSFIIMYCHFGIGNSVSPWFPLFALWLHPTRFFPPFFWFFFRFVFFCDFPLFRCSVFPLLFAIIPALVSNCCCHVGLVAVAAALSRQVHKEISIKMQQCRTPSSSAKLTNRDTFPWLPLPLMLLLLRIRILALLLSSLEFGSGSHQCRTSRQWLANEFSLLKVWWSARGRRRRRNCHNELGKIN